VPEHEANKIMRIVLPIGAHMLIANDVPEGMGPVNEIGIQVKMEEEIKRFNIFQR
jgi:hypothetical protein